MFCWYEYDLKIAYKESRSRTEYVMGFTSSSAILSLFSVNTSAVFLALYRLMGYNLGCLWSVSVFTALVVSGLVLYVYILNYSIYVYNSVDISSKRLLIA